MVKINVRVGISLLIGLGLLILAIIVSFFISLILPGDPILAYLPEHFNQAQYEAAYHYLGFDQPLFFRFFRYFGDMITGNWGNSLTIARGMPVFELLATRMPRTFDLLFLPLVIGLLLGFLLGHLSIRTSYKSVNRIVQVLALIGLAVPILFLAMSLQFTFGYVFDLLPATGFKDFSLPDPPYITGFRILDSLISGNFALIPDYLEHLILPWITLTFSITMLTVILVRIYRINRAKEIAGIRSIGAFTLYIGVGFAMVFLFVIITETLFGFAGFGQLIITALVNSDYWVINGTIYLSFMNFIIIMVLFLLIIILVQNRKVETRTWTKSSSQANEDDMIYIDDSEEDIEEPSMNRDGFSGYIKLELKELKNYLLMKLKSPWTIIGLAIVVFTVILAIFPHILTPYTYEEALGIYAGAYSPPSPDHILGQTKFGRDVLARIIYSLPSTLWLGFFDVLIGLVLGLTIGIPLLLLNKRLNFPTEVVLIPIYAIPIIIIPIITYVFSGTFLTSFGLFFAPIFVHLIVNSRFSLSEISKKIIPYIPLLMGISILLYSLLGFIGFSDPMLIDLGSDIGDARLYLYAAPWASLFPCLALFILFVGFFIFYAGLQKSPSELLTSSERE